jgi:hypothetical protein
VGSKGSGDNQGWWNIEKVREGREPSL